MKKKEMKKLAKNLYNKIKQGQVTRIRPVKKSKLQDVVSEFLCNQDSEISDKIYNLCLRILKFSDSISIEMNSEYILVGTNLNDIYVGQKNSSNRPIKSEGQLEIRIFKNQGFTLTYNHENPIKFEDKNLYNKLFDDMRVKYNEVTKNRISYIINEVMINSKLARDNNLDKLLD